MAKRMRPLNTHGITKINFDELHPLAEKPEDPSVIVDATSERFLQLSPEQESLSSSHGSSSVATVRSVNGFFSDSISSSIGTGVTERSSICSWGIDDEFDEQAANHVRWMFDEVDSCLFEDVQIPSTEIRDECSDWKLVYPHLRILGSQLVSSNESGTEMIATPSHMSTPVTESTDDQRSGEEVSQLNINGYKVEAVTAPPTSTKDEENESSLSFLEEEIFAIDGDVEEYIAYDNNHNIDYHEHRDKRNMTKKKYPSFPPMTPNAFVHETALSECFDHLWNEIIPILKRLLVLYSEARAKKELERVQESFDHQMDRFLDSSLELPQSRDNYGRLQPLPTPLKIRNGTGSNGLQELMTIRSLELQQRAPSVTPHGSTNEEMTGKDHTNGRPLSSVHRQFPKTTNFRNAEQQFYERMLSAKTPKRNIRLQPIPQKSTGQISENANVGEVRGTRLQTAGSVSSVSGLWGARHTLPPLDRLGTAETTLSENRVRHNKRNGRASSAVSNDSKLSPNRDRTSFQPLPDSRPYTMHASSRMDLAFQGKSLSSSKLRDLSSSKSFISSNVFSDSLYPFPTQMKNMTISSVGEENEVDDFVLFGHGPPLLPPQQRKGKATSTIVR